MDRVTGRSVGRAFEIKDANGQTDRGGLGADPEDRVTGREVDRKRAQEDRVTRTLCGHGQGDTLLATKLDRVTGRCGCAVRVTRGSRAGNRGQGRYPSARVTSKGGGGGYPHLSRRPFELRTVRDRHDDPGVGDAQNSITRCWRRVGGVLAMRGAEGFWPTHTKNVTLATSYRARAAVGRPPAHTSPEGI